MYKVGDIVELREKNNPHNGQRGVVTRVTPTDVSFEGFECNVYNASYMGPWGNTPGSVAHAIFKVVRKVDRYLEIML
jgi:hypothetical protein